jgi:hypothetical protein
MLDVSDKCKRLAEHLHRADPSRKLLVAECEVSGHSPNSVAQANDTRWDSRLTNMQSVLYHEDCLLRLARKGKLVVKDKERVSHSLVPSIQEFQMAAAGVKILKLCQVTTKLFEQEKVPTMPHVVERMFTVDKELEAISQDMEIDEMSQLFAAQLRENLSEQRRFPEFGINREMNRFGNYLNPALQGLHLGFYDKLEITKTELEAKLGIWRGDVTTAVASAEEEEDGPPPAKLTPTQLLRRQMEEKAAAGQARPGARGRRVPTAPAPVSAFRKECQEYEALHHAAQDVDQLGWWRIHQEQFPLLSFLARVVFSVPVASSKSERVFSAAGRCVRPDRSRLAPEMVESLVVMCCNLPLLKEMGLRK